MQRLLFFICVFIVTLYYYIALNKDLDYLDRTMHLITGNDEYIVDSTVEYVLKEEDYSTYE